MSQDLPIHKQCVHNRPVIISKTNQPEILLLLSLTLNSGVRYDWMKIASQGIVCVNAGFNVEVRHKAKKLAISWGLVKRPQNGQHEPVDVLLLVSGVDDTDDPSHVSCLLHDLFQENQTGSLQLRHHIHKLQAKQKSSVQHLPNDKVSCFMVNNQLVLLTFFTNIQSQS